jgi:uncharacterized membrane protein
MVNLLVTLGAILLLGAVANIAMGVLSGWQTKRTSATADRQHLDGGRWP